MDFVEIMKEIKNERDGVTYVEYIKDDFFFIIVPLTVGALNYLQIRVYEGTICFSVNSFFQDDNIFQKPREIVYPQTTIGRKDIKGIVARSEELTKKKLFDKKFSRRG